MLTSWPVRGGRSTLTPSRRGSEGTFEPSDGTSG